MYGCGARLARDRRPSACAKAQNLSEKPAAIERSASCALATPHDPSDANAAMVRRIRLQTQSYPPDHERSEHDSGGKVGRELVVARGDPAKVFEPAEHPFD